MAFIITEIGRERIERAYLAELEKQGLVCGWRVPDVVADFEIEFSEERSMTPSNVPEGYVEVKPEPVNQIQDAFDRMAGRPRRGWKPPAKLELSHPHLREIEAGGDMSPVQARHLARELRELRDFREGVELARLESERTIESLRKTCAEKHREIHDLKRDLHRVTHPGPIMIASSFGEPKLRLFKARTLDEICRGATGDRVTIEGSITKWRREGSREIVFTQSNGHDIDLRFESQLLADLVAEACEDATTAPASGYARANRFKLGETECSFPPVAVNCCIECAALAGERHLPTCETGRVVRAQRYHDVVPAPKDARVGDFLRNGDRWIRITKVNADGFECEDFVEDVRVPFTIVVEPTDEGKTKKDCETRFDNAEFRGFTDSRCIVAEAATGKKTHVWGCQCVPRVPGVEITPEMRAWMAEHCRPKDQNRQTGFNFNEFGPPTMQAPKDRCCPDCGVPEGSKCSEICARRRAREKALIEAARASPDVARMMGFDFGSDRGVVASVVGLNGESGPEKILPLPAVVAAPAADGRPLAHGQCPSCRVRYSHRVRCIRDPFRDKTPPIEFKTKPSVIAAMNRFAEQVKALDEAILGSARVPEPDKPDTEKEALCQRWACDCPPTDGLPVGHHPTFDEMIACVNSRKLRD